MERTLTQTPPAVAQASGFALRPPEITRSPLRYPGGKSRAVKTILNMLPSDLDVLASPFMGGGSIELAVASQGVRVYGYDAFRPLVVFWRHLLKDPQSLARAVAKLHPLSRDAFYDLQKAMRSGGNNDEASAAIFYALNRASFSGTTLSGGMSPTHPRFTQSAIDRLRDFHIDGLCVQHMDFAKSLARHPNDFIYADPPYANGGALYGQKGDYHKDFDHKQLADILTNRDRWILSYNDCDTIRDLYHGFTFLTPEWTYGMNHSKKSNEVLILSHGIKPPCWNN